MKKINFSLLQLAVFVFGMIFIAFFFSQNTDVRDTTEKPVYPFEVLIENYLSATLFQTRNSTVEKRVEVDLSRQKVILYENGANVKEFTISSGKKNTPTPTGNFRVHTKIPVVYSNIAKCWLPFWVGFTTDGLYGFHEFPICSDGRRGLDQLGSPASLGCIRMGLEESENFYKWVEIGVPITIYAEKKESILPEETEWCYNFRNSLVIGNRGYEVTNLQNALAKEEIFQDPLDGYFGKRVFDAVVVFQEKYTTDVLGPWNLTKGTGFVGPTTLRKLNQLYGCH